MDEKDTIYARWLSGNLSEAELEELKANGELEELESIVKLTDEMALPAFNVDAAYKQFQSERSKPVAKQRRLPVRWILAAAATITLVGVFLFYLNSQPTLLQAVAGENLTHSFADGSKIILNDESTASYYPKNWEENRLVTLNGEAFFDVVKGRKFEVQTEQGTIQVLGTSFNIRSRGSNLMVACYTGKVRVRSAIGTDSVVLEKGKYVQFVGGKNMGVKDLEVTGPHWTNGESHFIDETMSAVFQELERQYAIKVDYASIDGQLLFNGKFEHNNLEAALKSICVPQGFQFSIDSNNKLVRITEK